MVYGDSSITHLINGDTVLRYSKPSIGGGVVNGYDSTVWKPGTRLTSGYVALQSEGQPIDFKNIKIRELK
ncbi:MAG: family 16 glycoside hydrolase [Bacteroidota bacterium]